MIPLIDSILGRMSCPAHDGQIVQTFCKRKQCLKFLCSKCQMLHTQEHDKLGSLPDFEAIQITIDNCSKLLDEQIKQTEKSKQIFKKQQQTWQKKKRKLFNQLDGLQQQLIDEVCKVFADIRRNTNKKIINFENNVGIKQGDNFQDLYQFYEKQIEELQKCKGLLKKPNCCAQLKSIFGEIIPRSSHLIKESTQFAVANLHQNLKLNINAQEIKNWLSNSLANRIGISFDEKNSRQVLIQNKLYQISQNPKNVFYVDKISPHPKVILNHSLQQFNRPNSHSNMKQRIHNNINSEVIYVNNHTRSPMIVEKYENLPLRRSSLFGRGSRCQNFVR